MRLTSVVLCLLLAVPASAGSAPINAVHTSTPCVALTFDDGPDRVQTPRLLAILEQRHISATFFVIGTRVTAHPEIVRRAHDDGDEVGNHSWNHPFFTLIASRDVRWQIHRTDTAINSATGSMPVLLRAPYGSLSHRVLGLEKRSFIGWNVDTLDWHHHDTAWIVQSLDAVHDGSIIIMHDTHATTIDAVPEVIDRLIARGFFFGTVSELRAGTCPMPDIIPGT